MSDILNLNSDGEYAGYERVLKFYNDHLGDCPKGVSLKLERKKYLSLQFVHPGTDKRLPKSCNVQFTEKGIIEAVDKAWKVKNALEKFKTSSEFWAWYDAEILNKNNIENDLKTYREIFKEIEEEYWNGTHKNTGEKRDKNCPSFRKSYRRTYLDFFKKFDNWDNYPDWEKIKNVLFSWEQGSKSFKDFYLLAKRIASYCPQQIRQSMIEKLDKIDGKQTIFKEKQSISIDEFLNWYTKSFNEIPSLRSEPERVSRRQWLWMASICVVYGLRPAEIMSAINLFNPVSELEIKNSWGNKGKKLGNSKVTIKAINDKSNTELLLVLGNQYYIGENFDIPITIKTGGRICPPLCTDKKIIELLNIQKPKLPNYIPEPESNPESLASAIANQFRDKLDEWDCPVTQAYAFRHLGNQLGEKYGIPQETRARGMGHSVKMNDSTYKSRENLQTTVDLLTNYARQPLGLDAAKFQLENSGFDLDDPSVKAILRIIYQLDD
jgi:integrase